MISSINNVRKRAPILSLGGDGRRMKAGLKQTHEGNGYKKKRHREGTRTAFLESKSAGRDDHSGRNVVPFQ